MEWTISKYQNCYLFFLSLTKITSMESESLCAASKLLYMMGGPGTFGNTGRGTAFTQEFWADCVEISMVHSDSWNSASILAKVRSSLRQLLQDKHEHDKAFQKLRRRDRFMTAFNGGKRVVQAIAPERKTIGELSCWEVQVWMQRLVLKPETVEKFHDVVGEQLLTLTDQDLREQYGLSTIQVRMFRRKLEDLKKMGFDRGALHPHKADSLLSTYSSFASRDSPTPPSANEEQGDALVVSPTVVPSAEAQAIPTAAFFKGRDFHVPEDLGSLEEAFDYVGGGDRILLAAGTYEIDASVLAVREAIEIVGVETDPHMVQIDVVGGCALRVGVQYETISIANVCINGALIVDECDTGTVILNKCEITASGRTVFEVISNCMVDITESTIAHDGKTVNLTAPIVSITNGSVYFQQCHVMTTEICGGNAIYISGNGSLVMEDTEVVNTANVVKRDENEANCIARVQDETDQAKMLMQCSFAKLDNSLYCEEHFNQIVNDGFCTLGDLSDKLPTGHGIEVRLGGKLFAIGGTIFRSPNYGVFATNPHTFVSLEKMLIGQCKQDGVIASDGSECLVRKCELVGNGGEGLSVSDFSTAVFVANCNIKNNHCGVWASDEVTSATMLKGSNVIQSNSVQNIRGPWKES